MSRKAHKSVKSTGRSKQTLREYLDSVLARAKHNNHQGSDRSKDLQTELARIEKRVTQTLDEINKEAEAGESPDDDAKISDKLDRTTEVLTNEMMQLAALYHRQKDVATIRKFLNDQREVIRVSMISGDKMDSGAGSLDGRISELHELMRAEHLASTARAARSG